MVSLRNRIFLRSWIIHKYLISRIRLQQLLADADQNPKQIMFGPRRILIIFSRCRKGKQIIVPYDTDNSLSGSIFFGV